MHTLTSFAPLLAGIAGAVVALGFDAWGRPRLATAAAAAGLTIGGLWALVPAPDAAALSTFIAAGPAAACMLVSAVALLGGVRSLSDSDAGGRMAALAALAATAAAALASALDLLILLLALETLALCGYGIVALAGTPESREAAMKWFVQGAVSTAVLIAGVAALVGTTGGSLSYPAIQTAAGSALQGGAAALPFAGGLTLVLAALAFKAGAFPLHAWAPDAYETAPPVGAAVLASAGKVGALSALVWVAFAAFTMPTPLLPKVAVAVMATASIVFGNLAALRQRSLARMLAYSGIAQVGYALAGLPSITSGAVAGVPSTLLFAVLYAVAVAAGFLIVAAVREHDPEWDGAIGGLAGLSRRSPVLAVALAVVMFSLTGIPLTGGFWGKLLVFASAATGGWLWLAVVGMLGSVVSFGYYGGVLRAAFLDDSGEAGPSVRAQAGPATRAATALAALLLAVGVAPLFTGLGPLVAVFFSRL